MNNQYVPTPVPAYYYPPQAMGGYYQPLGQAPNTPVADSSIWLIAGLAAAAFFWFTSERKKSRDF